ncbi:hypothetical protein [Sulfurimonas sp.]
MKKLLLSGVLATLLTSSLMAKDISTYEYANLQSSDAVKTALTNKGFTVVGEYDAMGNPNYHIVAYTNDSLEDSASKENRGFAAVQKVLVDKTDKKLVFTNPEYFLHAFLQDDFKEADAQKINKALSAAFGTLSGSKDALEDDDIAGFHFMMGMPYYEDMIEIAEGSDLLQKLKKNAGKNIVFELKLKNSTLVGVAMPTADGEKSYVTAIEGQEHSAFLPYMILIEGNKAKIMHPKYYLAISYPELSMGQFMTISSTPGDIEDYMTALVTK